MLVLGLLAVSGLREASEVGVLTPARLPLPWLPRQRRLPLSEHCLPGSSSPALGSRYRLCLGWSSPLAVTSQVLCLKGVSLTLPSCLKGIPW